MGRYVRPGDRKHQRTAWAAADTRRPRDGCARHRAAGSGQRYVASPTGAAACRRRALSGHPSVDRQRRREQLQLQFGRNVLRSWACHAFRDGGVPDREGDTRVVHRPRDRCHIRHPSPSGGKDPKTHFSFEVSGSAAVVYHVGVKGGTKVSWYDYFNNAPNAPADGVSRGVSSDTNLHSSPDSQYNASAVPPKFTFNVASITTFCYRALAVTPSCDEPFDAHSLDGGCGVLGAAAEERSRTVCKSDDVVMFTAFDDNGERFATLHPVAPGGGTVQGRRAHRVERVRSRAEPDELWYDDTAPTVRRSEQEDDAPVQDGPAAGSRWQPVRLAGVPWMTRACCRGTTPPACSRAPTLPLRPEIRIARGRTAPGSIPSRRQPRRLRPRLAHGLDALHEALRLMQRVVCFLVAAL